MKYRLKKKMAKKVLKEKEILTRKEFFEKFNATLDEIRDDQVIQRHYMQRCFAMTDEVKKFKKLIENDAKKYAMLRDCMLNQIKLSEPLDKENAAKILEPYINQLEFFLEEKGVNILKAKEGDTFDSKIHEPLSRIEVECDNLHETIAEVYNEGYWIKGEPVPFQKIMVKVYINPYHS